jgi:hypothetical protein
MMEKKFETSVMIGWVLLSISSLIYFFANLQKVIVPAVAFDELQYAFSLDAA